MAFSLKKLLEGAAAQANPFDGGKTYSSVVRNQPTRTPAQTPPPQSGNMNFAGSKTYGTFNRPSPVVNAAQKQIAQTPNLNTKNRYAQVNAPSYGSGLSGLLNRAKDVVDANTAQDRFKRTQIGQPEVVKPMQQSPVVNNFIKPMVDSTARSINTFGGNALKAGELSLGLDKVALASVFGSDQDYKNARRKLDKSVSAPIAFSNNGGLLHTGTHTKTVEDLNDKKKFYGSMVQTGTDIGSLIPVGTGAKLAAGVAQNAGKQLLKQSGASAVLNLANEAGRQLTADGKIDPKGLAISGGIGAAFPVAGYGLGKGAKATTQLVSKAADPIQNALKNTGKALDNFKVEPTVAMTTPDGQVIRVPKVENKNNPPFTNVADKSTRRNKVGGYKNIIPQNPQNVNPIRGLDRFKLNQKGSQVGDIPNPLPKTQGGYARMPFGKDVSKGLSKEQTEFINDYANMLEEMGTGNGVYIDKNTGTRMTQNYRPPEFKGKTVTKEQWFEKARKEIESGRAGFGASEDYKLLPKAPKTEGVAPKSAPVEKTVEQTPFGPVKATGLPKNQVESVVPEQNLSQKSPQQSQPLQTKTSQETLKNTSEPIIPTESVRTPEGFIPEAKLASQGKPPKQATAKLLDSAKKSDVIPEDMVQAIDPTRSVKTNKETWTKAGQKLHELGDDGALNYFHENHGADSNAVAWRLYEKRLANGDNNGAQELLADMTTRSIENGQAAQAWAMIKRLDPKYITQKLDRQVDAFRKSDKFSERVKSRVDWSADKQARISKYATDMSSDEFLTTLSKTNNIEKIAELTGIQDEGILKGLAKTSDSERIKMLLTTNFNKEINSILPSSLGDKAVAYWKSGLLSAPVTHVRNIVGNTVNSAFNTVETPMAGVFDSTFGRMLTPTKRTVSANPLIGQGKGYKQGGQDFVDALRYGITKDDAGKFDYKSINWNKNNPVEMRLFKPFTDAIFRTLGAEDKIFKQPGVMHSLYNQAEAAAISAGKRGDGKWMADWVENAPAIVKETAKKEGGAWVFQKDTVVSNAMRGLKNSLKQSNPGFEKVIDVIQPFVNVPAAIGSDLLTYTPAGLLRVGNKARHALNKNIDLATRDTYRRAAMKDLSKTTVGGGLIAAGLAMGYSGDASGTMPPKNTKEYDEWMQENRQANSIRVGNKWFNINSIGPQASLFNAAAQTGAWMKRNESKGKANDPLTSAVAFGGNVATNWFNASSLTGASNAQKAISDPVRYGQDYVARQATSFIPNFAKRLGAGVDPNVREGESFKDAVLAQIPFARTNAPVKTDSTGTPVVNNSYGAMGMKSLFDPFNISTAKDGGNSVVNQTSNRNGGVAVQDLKEAKQITKTGYGKEWSTMSEDDIRDKAIAGDEKALQVYNSLKAQEKVYAKPNMPTPGLSKGAEDILNQSKKFTETGKGAWGNRPTESKEAKNALKSWINQDIPVTNDVAVEWAKFEQKRVKGELNPLEENEAKTALLRKAVSSTLNEDERKYYNVADDKLIGALQKGWVKPDSLAKALDVDAQLLKLGLITKSGFGKKVWNALGIAMPSVAGASSGIRSSGRKTSRAKSTKLKASKTPISFTKVKNRQKSVNSSLRKLLGSAKV